MKNQYVGDVSDYRKYGLLRVLQAEGSGQLLVAWMLTPDDGSKDGSLRSYLDNAERWRGHDPELFDGLRRVLRNGAEPAVSLIEDSGLLPRSQFFRALVPDSRQEREDWRHDLAAAAHGADFVFLDPDNGIEVPSKRVGRAGSSKYVTWDEVEALWALGCSVLVYQHFSREPRDTFARRLVGELGSRTGARYVEAFRTPHVLFLLALQDRHAHNVDRWAALLRTRWVGQVTAMGLTFATGDHGESDAGSST